MSDSHVPEDRSRGDRTAARLEMIAVDLVLERGLAAVTVDDICHQAGISQRTFFNHFRTKEEAVFGRDLAGIDEREAREFLVSQSRDVIADAMRLVLSAQSKNGERALLLKRKQLIHSNPLLVGKHLEKMKAVRAELTELIYLRIKAHAPAGETELETRGVASIIAELAGVLLRLSVESQVAWPDPEGASALLAATLERARA